MALSFLLLTILVVAGLAYVLAKSRAFKSAGGDIRLLHSLPGYYGWNGALTVLLPTFLALLLWLAIQPVVVDHTVSGMISAESAAESTLGLVMSDVRRIADGLDLAVQNGVLTAQDASRLNTGSSDIRETLGAVGVALGAEVTAEKLEAAQTYRSATATGFWMRTVLVLLVALGGLAVSYRRTDKDFRARNFVEQVVKGILVFAALLAILTTVGIIFSLIFNTVEFFSLYPAEDFFFGLVWSPSFGGGSELGILPLIWATLYISLIALAVAVPVGLFAAIYLSEYASPTVRAVAKPLLEVLAGIPTIVYGLFALLTVGPLLVDIFGNDGALGVGWMQGGTAVMTAGLVMGIMLIPFVSSLSDDIINAVPQAMRDGSLGLGATHSETVKQVIMPAALPGIVGAILLAASRAIGETMIVVLGAGAAARLSMNPFDAMTTVTAKIVSQLTGDADFASPEALVAFALGMTLFVITLGLNIFALYIVRKYREQYD
ncbi:phosphate ABC transporter permease subunit PstC [Roseibium sp. CAU 1637]|uniref:Phosphate transport system permease protein n=1 Tax=Roseibium limicola TaxID=2816037 RepID=A0A939EMT1_9HYPH|nr:phosphate ABC transporter permease subunit PstC [Roseibium limicola]MBO0345461.1 phosphate ABC transporter permease subunit PstC [Roseibium limicola]